MTEELSFDPNRDCVPLVVRNCNGIKDWACYRWKCTDWSANFGQSELTFRLHQSNSDLIPWENEADGRVNTTLDHYIRWRKDTDVPKSNPFIKFDVNRFWAYSSYNHLIKLPIQSLINSINWSSIGFGINLGSDGKSSTIWIGSKGAATPCHYDTYGHNLVAQIVGRKLWILFPPKDTKNLYPIRIPFEESSVFSEVNIEIPEYELHPKFRDSLPHVVILDPGDVLYVPHHWWHYVKCLDDGPDGLCISINQWLPSINSNLDSLTEGLTSLLVASLFPFHQPDDEDWLVGQDVKTTLTDPSTLIGIVSQLARTIKSEPKSIPKVNHWIDSMPIKCLKIDSVDCEQLRKYFPLSNVDIDKNRKCDGERSKRRKKEREVSRRDILNSILEPSVIELIVKNLLDKVQSD